MKRIALVLLAAVCLFTGCKKSDKSGAAGSGAGKKVKIGFVYVGSAGDQGYTQAHDKARISVEELGVKTFYVENVSDTNSAECEAAYKKLIEENGCTAVFATWPGFAETTKRMAEAYPNVIFNQCGVDISNNTNIGSYAGKMYEAKFVEGFLAGGLTNSNKVGYVAAFKTPECISNINAFYAGLKSNNPEASLYISWIDSWSNPDKEKSAVDKLAEKGCDFITHQQNTPAVIEECFEKQILCAGNNFATPDIGKKYYTTGTIYNWLAYYASAVQKIVNGEWEPSFVYGGMNSSIVEFERIYPLEKKINIMEYINLMAQVQVGILNPFAGPIFDTTGALRVGEGDVLSDEDILNMDWFVKGINYR